MTSTSSSGIGGSSSSRPRSLPRRRYSHMEALNERWTQGMHLIRVTTHSSCLCSTALTSSKYRSSYTTGRPNRSLRFLKCRCRIRTLLSLNWCSRAFLLFSRSSNLILLHSYNLIFLRSYKLDYRRSHRTPTSCHRFLKDPKTMPTRRRQQTLSNRIGPTQETSSPEEEPRVSRRIGIERVAMILEDEVGINGD